MPRVRNWAGNQRCTPWRVERPADEAALAGVLRRAAAEGLRVRAVGAHHSWSAVAACDEVLVSLDAMQGVREVQGTRARVGGGTRIARLNQELAARGLVLPMVGSVDQQSIAGAISTSTHGSGLAHGTLSTRVTSLRLVLASGERREVSAEEDPALFDAARAGLGLYGLISELTLEAAPAHRLVQEATPMPLDEALERLPEALASHPHVKLWWFPHQARALLLRAAPGEDPPTPRTLAERVDAAVLNPLLFPALLALGAAWRGAVAPLHRLVAASYFQPARRVGLPFEVLHLAMPPRHLEAEYALPVEHAVAGFRAMIEAIERADLRVNFLQELRFTAADALPLSPCHGRDTAWVSAYTARWREAPALFAAVEAALAPFDPRPHWGKLHGFGPRALAAAYPRWAEAMALREAVDPEGRFLSPQLAAMIGAPATLG